MKRNKIRIARVAFALLLTAGSVVTLVRQQMWKDRWEPGQVVYHTQSRSMDTPTEYTDEELTAVMVANANEDPLPPDWTVYEHTRIKGVYTGIHDDETHAKLVTVTLEDDGTDLESAELHLDGEVVFRVSRDDGSLVDEDGTARATMLLWLPMPPFEVGLVYAIDGGEREREEWLRVR